MTSCGTQKLYCAFSTYAVVLPDTCELTMTIPFKLIVDIPVTRMLQAELLTPEVLSRETLR